MNPALTGFRYRDNVKNSAQMRADVEFVSFLENIDLTQIAEGIGNGNLFRVFVLIPLGKYSYEYSALL